MQGNNFNTQEILPRRDAVGEVEVSPAVVLDHVVDTPFPAAGIEAILPDLEPLLAARASARSVVDFGKICDDRSLVGLSNRIIGVIGELGSPNNVSPESSKSVSVK